jgi:transposase
MLIDLQKVNIYVKPGITDMRKAVNGLSLIVSESMDLDVLSGSLFLFCNRDRRLLKGIYWDGTGFWLVQKRLEKHKFPWPKSEESARQITGDQVKMLLSGINFWEAHERLSYDQVV